MQSFRVNRLRPAETVTYSAMLVVKGALARTQRTSETAAGVSMRSNPYESPRVDEPALTEAPVHRSFRLTRGSGQRALSLRDAVYSAPLWQVPLLLITSTTLDGGALFRGAVASVLAYWIILGMIALQRRRVARAMDFAAGHDPSSVDTNATAGR